MQKSEAKMRQVLLPALTMLCGAVSGAAFAQATAPAVPVAGVETGYRAPPGGTADVGRTGFDVKRPVFAGAPRGGPPWGEIGDFVREAMAPAGYSVVLCRNCNLYETARLVGKTSYPPPLSAKQIDEGTVRPNATVDFGVSVSYLVAWAYEGKQIYSKDGPYKNLRLIANIEDPWYLLMAVKADSGISDLRQVAERHLPAKVLYDGTPTATAVLDYYGITAEKLSSWGGSLSNALGGQSKGDFDVVISSTGGPSNNPETSFWTAVSQREELKFLDVPADLAGQLERDEGMKRVIAKTNLLRGVDRPVSTVAFSGEAIFTRADAPDAAVYEIAKAIDAHRANLIWYIRPYSYDPRTVAIDADVPLHPGAKRYYREMGYIK